MGKEEELFKAVKAKDIKKVKKLLTYGSVKKREEASCQNVDTGHKIRKHLTHIDVNARDPETGYTPLLQAVLGGLHDVADLLLFHSANVKIKDVKGNTALHLAVFGDRADLVTLLLINGAEVDSVNIDLNTALHIACQYGAKNHVILKLVEAGANVWLKNKDNHTPLDTAAMYNKKEVVSILMDHHPTLSSNQCAIVEAAMRDSVEVVELLLEHGVDPNQLDSVRKSTALHEAVRFCRVKSAEMLLSFGADAGKENQKKETPRTLCKELPAPFQERFETLFKEQSNSKHRIPKHLAQRESQLPESFKSNCLKDYPVLPTQSSWTQNTREFCSSCTEANNNLHVVDDDPRTFWVIREVHDAWTILDLGSPHIITGITIVGWDSPQMVQSFQLQAAESVQGPWSTFTAHKCKREGSSNPKEPGVGQTFKGFTAQIRYLRLYIVDNHGGDCICFQGIHLHGADCVIFDILDTCQMRHLGDHFIEQGINTYRKLLDITELALSTLIQDPVDMLVLYQAIQEKKRYEHPMSVLQWLVSPAHYGFTSEPLPDFSVQSDPEVMEDVEVIIEGAELQGQTIVPLSPMGEGKPSTAIFHGLYIKTVGRFLIRVQGIRSKIILDSAEQIEIRPARRRNSSDISAAFDEIQNMLSQIQDTL